MYGRIVPFLKASRLFSICFCLALSGAAASTLASSSLIWSFKWVSWSAKLWSKERRKILSYAGLLRVKGFFSWYCHVLWSAMHSKGLFFRSQHSQMSETETQRIKRKMCICRTVMLLAYFSRVFFISLSCGRRRWTFSSSCSLFSWQPCSFDTFSFSLLSIWSSCRKHMNIITSHTLMACCDDYLRAGSIFIRYLRITSGKCAHGKSLILLPYSRN